MYPRRNATSGSQLMGYLLTSSQMDLITIYDDNQPPHGARDKAN